MSSFEKDMNSCLDYVNENKRKNKEKTQKQKYFSIFLLGAYLVKHKDIVFDVINYVQYLG